MTHIAYYISSHGYGHAARQQPVIRLLAEEGFQVHVRTAAPRKFFKTAASYHEQHYDIGMIQRDALTLDIEASLRWIADFMDNRAALIQQEVDFIRQQGIKLVVSDMPPIAFEIAEAAGIPSIAVTHFTWDWVYDFYTDAYPQYDTIVEELRRGYLKATLALQMPFAHEFDMFQQVEEIPLLVNRPTQTRAQIRESLHIPDDVNLALLSMGGHEWAGSQIEPLPGWVFLVMPGVWDKVQHRPQHFRRIPPDYDDYHNLIAAADVVIGKAGGSTVAEVIGHRRPMIYTTNPQWRESVLLDEALQRYAVSIHISPQAFRAGDWIHLLPEVIQQPPPSETIATNGAQIAAAKISELAR